MPETNKKKREGKSRRGEEWKKGKREGEDGREERTEEGGGNSRNMYSC